eukprot:Gb_28629 [translate_table: standard]
MAQLRCSLTPSMSSIASPHLRNGNPDDLPFNKSTKSVKIYFNPTSVEASSNSKDHKICASNGFYNGNLCSTRDLRTCASSSASAPPSRGPVIETDGGGGNGSGNHGGNYGGGGGGDGSGWDASENNGGEKIKGGLLGSFLRGWKSRVEADPQFPFKVLMEELVGLPCQHKLSLVFFQAVLQAICLRQVLTVS